MKTIQKQILCIVMGIVLLMMPVGADLIPGTEIIVVKGEINDVYLLETDDGYIAIDTGMEKDTIAAGLDELSIQNADIKYVLLTHADFDHVGGLGLFPDAEVYISEDEVQMIDGTTERAPSIFNELPADINADDFILLTEQQELTIGGHTILCIKTPGHTPGSMSYLIDEKYLFTGDIVQVENNTIMSVHPSTMDEAQAKQTIQFLKTIKNDALVLTAHFGFYTGRYLF